MFFSLLLQLEQKSSKKFTTTFGGQPDPDCKFSDNLHLSSQNTTLASFSIKYKVSY